MMSRVLRHISFESVYCLSEGHVLGEGLNGKVFRAAHKRSDRRVAIKRLGASARRPSAWSGLGDESLPDELNLYLQLSHPNICRLLEAFVEEDGDAWLCMEYCRGGELFEQVAGTSQVPRETAVCDCEERVARLVKQMAAAFRYLHGMRIVHRDNKLENWVFASPTQERIKLIDFGFAVLVPVDPAAPRLTRVCGTCYYVAPEVLSVRNGRLSEGSGYGTEVDIWALGVILYMLLSGAAPFVAEADADILWEIAAPGPSARLRNSPFGGRRWQHVHEPCIDLIARCLDRDPRTRLTAADVQAHEWLQAEPLEVDTRQVSQALTDLLVAGTRCIDSRMLAFVSGHLALRKFIGPEQWTHTKEVFAVLEGPEMRTPHGYLVLSELVATCARECDLQRIRGLCKVDAPDDEELCRVLLEALDMTGDGRLQFYEFFGALIAAGRVAVQEHEVEDAFRALDRDRDGIISEEDMSGVLAPPDLEDPALTSGLLPLPVTSFQAISRLLCCVSPEEMKMGQGQLQRAMSDVASRTAAGSSPRSRLWTTAGHTWKVARRFAFEGYLQDEESNADVRAQANFMHAVQSAPLMLHRQSSSPS